MNRHHIGQTMSESAGKRRKKFGRPSLPRLPNLDLRTAQGRAFSRHYRRLVAEFPDQELAARDLAGIRASIEMAQGESLSKDSDPLQAARAREALPRLFRLAAKLEEKLEATRPPPSADRGRALSDILARHQPEAAE